MATLCVLPFACATEGAGGPARVPHKDRPAAAYYPLDSGWKWAYDVQKDGGNILATYAVVERAGDVAVVQAGDERLTYAVTPDGVAQKDGDMLGDYVIKNPVTIGATWTVGGGGAKIVAVSDDVTVDAGHYADCVVVEVTRVDPMRVARTTFAPDVGPVAIELQVQEGDKFVTTTRARLRGLTRPDGKDTAP